MSLTSTIYIIYNIPVYIVAQDIIIQYFTPLPPTHTHTHTQTSARVLFFSYIPISFFLPIPNTYMYTVQVLRHVITYYYIVYFILSRTLAAVNHRKN